MGAPAAFAQHNVLLSTWLSIRPSSGKGALYVRTDHLFQGSRISAARFARLRFARRVIARNLTSLAAGAGCFSMLKSKGESVVQSARSTSSLPAAKQPDGFVVRSASHSLPVTASPIASLPARSVAEHLQTLTKQKTQRHSSSHRFCVVHKSSL